MGYNNPAFVDDNGNKSSNTRTNVRHDDKHTTINPIEGVLHGTTVNYDLKSVFLFGMYSNYQSICCVRL